MKGIPKRRKRAWTFVRFVGTWEQGKEHVNAFLDGGRNPLALWKMLPGGEPLKRRMFQCKAHDGCKVECRLVRYKTQELALERAPEEKHKRAANDRDRKNSSLTKKQKKECKYCMRYGGSPWDALRYEAYYLYMGGAKVRNGPNGCYVVGTPIRLDHAPVSLPVTRDIRGIKGYKGI